MSISKDNYMRLFQSIDNVSESTKAGKKGQEAGVKAYDLDKMGPARKFFAKQMGIEYKTADGKVVYLDKTSLSKFLARNKAIASEKDFNPKTCIEQLKNLHVPIASKIQAAFKGKDFEVSETDLKAICRGLGMSEGSANGFIGMLAAYTKNLNPTGPQVAGRTTGPQQERRIEIRNGDISKAEVKDFIKFLADNCKPEPMIRQSFRDLLNNLKKLGQE